MEENREEVNRFYRLNDLENFELGENDVDVRGWKFLDAEHQPLGVVHDIIMDADSNEVRYFDVLLDDEYGSDEDERHILLPVGVARISNTGDEIVLHEISRENFLSCPLFLGSEIDQEYEEALVNSLVPTPGTIARNPADFYTYEHFNSDKFYAGRRVDVNPG